MANPKVNEAKVIKEIVLKNEDGGEEAIEKGMLVSLNKLEDGRNDMSIRFCNLDSTEIDNILYGFSMLLKQDR